MILKTETIGEVVVAKVGISQLDIQTTEEFREEVASLASNRHLVLDLGAVEFIDSTGLGALLSLLRKLKLNSGDLRLTGIGAQVLSIFRLVRMNRVFEIYPSVEEAVSSFSWPSSQNEKATPLNDDTSHKCNDLGRSSGWIKE
jgi:anti-sigma B factor antagonist